MDVIALVGPAGTGKSHRALVVGHQHKADAIIDDGILIKDGKIIAGRSAKKEKNKIMAIRRAIFAIPGHADEVMAAIEKIKPERLLIIGTSETMAHKIAEVLHLPAVSLMIHIEEIASAKELEKASYYRKKEGKHIIPVPIIELKPHFSGFLVNPLQSFFKKPGGGVKKLGEKSIVRPIFSYYGRLEIDDSTITAIISGLARKNGSISKVSRVKVNHIRSGDDEAGIEISCDVVLYYGVKLSDAMRQTQAKIKEDVEYMTGMQVSRVNVRVCGLAVKAQP